MPSPKGGSIVVTGANGGLGSAIVSHIVADLELAACHGLYTVRDASAPNSALRSALSSQADASAADILSVDLSRLSSVRELAASINERVASGQAPAIKALVLNAGVLEFEQQTWTSDDDGSFDKTFAANYLGHWLLTLMLLQSMDRERGRVVVVGSAVHNARLPRNARHFNDDKWKVIVGHSTDAIAKGTWSSKEEDPSFHSGFRRYGASKLCLYMMVTELQRRLSADPDLGRITVVGVDPGSMNTSLARHANWFVRMVVFPVIIGGAARLLSGYYPNMVMRTPEKSAKDVMNAAMSSKWQSGGIYLDGSEIDDDSVSDEVKDAAKRALVWRDSVRYARLEKRETMLVDWQ